MHSSSMMESTDRRIATDALAALILFLEFRVVVEVVGWEAFRVRCGWEGYENLLDPKIRKPFG